MKKNSDEVMKGKFFETESDGDDFTYLLKIINLTEEEIICENLYMDSGLVRHSDLLGCKLNEIEANECQIVRMRKSKDKKISLNIMEDEACKEALTSDSSDNNKEIQQDQDEDKLKEVLTDEKSDKKKEIPQVQDDEKLKEVLTDENSGKKKETLEVLEELKGVVTFKLFRNRFDIAFSTQTDGTSNILIGAYYKNNIWMNKVNDKDYENRLLAEKTTPISQIFPIKLNERKDDIFVDKNTTNDIKRIPFEARIETEDSKFPLLIRYGIIYQPEENIAGSLNKYTISDSDAVAVVIIDIVNDQIAEPEDEQKEKI